MKSVVAGKNNDIAEVFKVWQGLFGQMYGEATYLRTN